MKKTFLLTSVCCFSLLFSFAQKTPTDTTKKGVPTFAPRGLTKEEEEAIIFTSVEQEAQFPGGLKAWSEFLSSKLSSFEPGKNGAPKGRYTVIAKFIVDKKGKISNVATETNHGYGMEKEVEKLIKQSPDWIPAYQNGRPVNAYRRQSVTFIVE